MCTFALTMSSRRESNNTRKISLYLVCSLLFLHEALPKCRENYGDSFRVIYGIYVIRRNIAKILVVDENNCCFDAGILNQTLGQMLCE